MGSHRSLAAIDRDIVAASDAFAAAQADAVDVPSNLARLVAGVSTAAARQLAGETAALSAAQAALDALLAEREATVEELAVRELLPRAALLDAMPPEGEAEDRVHALLDRTRRMIALLASIDRHYCEIAPLGDVPVAVSPFGPRTTWGHIQHHLGAAERETAEARILARELAAMEASLALPELPEPELGRLDAPRAAHAAGVAVRQLQNAYEAHLERLAVRAEGARARRRLRAAWARLHPG